MERYKVIDKSQSGHCCFEYTVVDTTKYTPMVGKEKYHLALCECFEKEDAEKICKALNLCNHIGEISKPDNSDKQ